MMANEINVTARLSVNNGSFRDQPPPITLQPNQAVAGGELVSPTIPAADTAIVMPALTCYGYAMLVNLDATNYVDVGPDNGSGAILPTLRLNAGEVALLRLYPGVSLRARANTAAVRISLRVYEN
jgi:hypothetical protein